MTDTLAFVHSARPALPLDTVAATLRETWGIEGQLKDLGGDRDQNLLITDAAGMRRLIKIGQADETPGVIDLQIEALRHIAAQDPGLCVPGVVPARHGAWTHAVSAEGGGQHLFRVFEYLPGKPILESSRTAGLMRAVGSTMARVDRALRGFHHPHAMHALLWDVRQAPAIRAHALEIGDRHQRDRVLRILDRFIESVLPRLSGLRAQVIHGDVTAENLLVSGDPPSISGLVDFGDAVHGSLAQELAVAMADTTWGMDDPWSAACDVVTGFDERMPLEAEELEQLWDLALARLALTAAVFATREARRAEGLGSMVTIVDLCGRQLDAFESVGRARALGDLRRAVRAPEAVAVTSAGAASASITCSSPS